MAEYKCQSTRSSLYTRRGFTTYGHLHAKMREVQAIYSGAARVPLPEVERNEIASVPNLMAQGIDQMSGRIASVVPNIIFTPKKNNVRKEQRRAIYRSARHAGLLAVGPDQHEAEEPRPADDRVRDEPGRDPLG